MSEYKEHKPGTFCWVDLATTDPEGAKKFYAEVFGWSATDEPAGPDMVYSRLSYDGRSVGALYKMSPEMLEQNIPPHWMSYVSVENVDETASRAKELDGTAQMEPSDVFDAGRMAVIQDPTGAPFAVWQPKAHHGAELRDAPGSLCWNELLTNDVDKSGAFYTRLFGWKADTRKFGGIEYTSFMVDEQSAAGGLMQITPEMGEGIPPNWFIYFSVDDCDATVQKVRDMGGKVHKEPMTMEDVGRFAIIEDQQGAVCGVIKTAEQPG
jgi:predicted enzyme related to lactoylglutathione lyase